ncbi:MAG TPA: cysteine desulfurase-like protein, partial [Gemmatimonadales bacterium]|nr:cysteine desulfurase-like protein [Gemmatimonadales bacterium]
MTASVEEIRRHFPALDRVHGGQPVAYFDGPGGTQVPRQVVDAMADYLYHHNANTHWAYPTSRETDAALLAAREAFADFLNAGPEEIAFGANMTTLTFHLARGLARAWGPGDEIVVTELDHHANVAPWQAVARERGIALRVVRMLPDSGTLDWADLEHALGPRTRLVALGAASNALGTVTDVARAAELARQVGALTYVDAVHFAAHALVDVGALGCDFLACSPYKFCGPHLGVVYVRNAVAQSIDVPKLLPAPDTAPERFETGTLNHEGIVGAAAAVDFFASLAPGATRRERLATALAALHVRGNALAAQLWKGLGGIPGVQLFGVAPGKPRTPTIAFRVAGIPAAAVAATLAGQGLFVSHGDFYAATV